LTRILHLSDLHFGFHRPSLVEPLLARINRDCSDLVVVTGDLTHRGRPGEYRLAAEFLSRIEAPVMAMPGNHDVPLYNLPVRFLRPFGGYRQAIDADLAPSQQVGGVRVQALNSTDPFAWQRGVLREGEIGRIIAGLDPLACNILALHHPLQQLPQVDKKLAQRAPEALARMAAAGVDLVLSGHLHVWASDGLLALGYPEILQIQAGTALCARISDGQNEYALLDIAADRVSVTRHIAPMQRDDFNDIDVQDFRRRDGVWQLADQSLTLPMVPGVTETALRTA
jgi:3',5'-cyclic AMP phosphodiesterase CpdA